MVSQVEMTVLIAVVTLAEAAGATLAMRAASAGLTTCALVRAWCDRRQCRSGDAGYLHAGRRGARAARRHRAFGARRRGSARGTRSDAGARRVTGERVRSAIHFMTLPIAGVWQTRRRR